MICLKKKFYPVEKSFTLEFVAIVHQTAPPTFSGKPLFCLSSKTETIKKVLQHVDIVGLASFFVAVWLCSYVIQLGLEPRTPTLKVLCSTGWATESFNCVSQLRLQRYIFLFLSQIYFELFSRIFCIKRVKTSLWFNWVSHSLIVNSDKRLKWSVYVTCFTK